MDTTCETKAKEHKEKGKKENEVRCVFSARPFAFDYLYLVHKAEHDVLTILSNHPE